MTRSHKVNDRDHVGLANGTASPEDYNLPRYFAKSGREGDDPKSSKKMGFGRGNWGRNMDELEDLPHNSSKPRRRSNSSTANMHLKSKFEERDDVPVFFDEEVHGASAVDFASQTTEEEEEEGLKLEKQRTVGSMESVEESKE